MPFASNSARLCLLALALLALGGCSRRKAADPHAAPGVIAGRVVGVDNTPVTGATVVAERAGSEESMLAARTTTNTKGDFVLPGLAPGRYVVRATASGHAAAMVSLELVTGDEVSTTLRLASEQVLEGRVLDARGQPVPYALVKAWPAGERMERTPETQTAAKGTFALAGLGRGAWTVLVEAPGFPPLQVDRVELPATSLGLRLEGESRRLIGVVLDQDGRPQPGARVVLGGPGLGTPRQATADPKGNYLFEGLGLGRFSLRASLERASSLPKTQIIDDGTGWLAPLPLTLGPGVFAEGQVVDDSGRPLGGALVEIVAASSDDLPEASVAGRDGRFSLGPLPPGRYHVGATLPGYVLGQNADIRLRVDVTPKVVLQLVRAARVSGRVLDDRGGPLPGSQVTMSPLATGQDELAVVVGALPLAVDAARLPGHALSRKGRRARTTVTDAEGRFGIEDLLPGRVGVEIAHPERLTKRLEPLLLGAAEARTLPDVVLAAGALLTGRVVDEQGAPLEGVRVEARPARGGRPATPIHVSTGHDGRFAVRVPAGEYTVVAHGAERALQSVFGLAAHEAAPPPPLELRLPRTDGSIEGEVHDTVGKPIARAQVMVVPTAPDSPAIPGAPWTPRETKAKAQDGTLTLASATSNSAGRFRLSGLPPGLVAVEVWHPDWPPMGMVAQVGTKLSVVLSRPGGIEGDVREKGTGTFVSAYRLKAVGPDGRAPEQIKTLGAGFELLGLQPGRWTLRIAADGYAPYERALDVPPGTSSREPSLRDVRVELSRAADAPTP